MKFNIEDLQKICSKMQSASSKNQSSPVKSVIEIKAVGTTLYMNVVAENYIAHGKIALTSAEDFHAVVNGEKFLKLIANITSESVEFNIKELKEGGKALYVKGNGEYKIPLQENVTIPEITIDNVINDFSINSDVLHSIVTYNSKEFGKGTSTSPIASMYYIDNLGAITFNEGACVNNFTLPEKMKMLVSQDIVNLFKLFEDDTTIHFVRGTNQSENGEEVQTRIKFESEDFGFEAKLSCDDTIVNKVKSDAIRNVASSADAKYTVSVDKSLLSQALGRILILGNADKTKNFGIFKCYNDHFEITDYRENFEAIAYNNSDNTGFEDGEAYTFPIRLSDLKITIDNCCVDNPTIRFGNHRSVVITHQNICNVHPEGATQN